MISSLICWYKGKHVEKSTYTEKDIFCEPNGRYLHTTYTINKTCKCCKKELSRTSGTKRKNL